MDTARAIDVTTLKRGDELLSYDWHPQVHARIVHWESASMTETDSVHWYERSKQALDKHFLLHASAASTIPVNQKQKSNCDTIRGMHLGTWIY